jgi:hypothetical protein
MTTPRFSVSQTDESVVITIHIPHVRVTNAEIYAEKNEFTFYCKPYLLKLSLPEEVCDDENCHAAYDPDKDNGTIVATLPKRNPGVYFPDLDLTTLLLQNRKLKDKSEFSFPSIEIVGESNDGGTDEIDDVGDASDVTDVKPEVDSLGIQIQSSHYGFNQKYSRVLSNLRDELADMIRLRDPDNTPVRERRELRLSTERTEFDPDRYLGDCMWGSEDMIFIEAMAWEAPWDRQWAIWKDFQQAHPNIAHSSHIQKGKAQAKENVVDSLPPAPAPAPASASVSVSAEASPPAVPDTHITTPLEVSTPADTHAGMVDTTASQSACGAEESEQGEGEGEGEAPLTVQRALAMVFELAGGFTETQQETMRSLPRRRVLAVPISCINAVAISCHCDMPHDSFNYFSQEIFDSAGIPRRKASAPEPH